MIRDSLRAVGLLLVSVVGVAAGPRVDIVVGTQAPPLERRAANELATVLKRIYDSPVQIAAEPPADAANIIFVGSPGTNPQLKSLGGNWPNLTSQGHVVRSIIFRQRPALVVGGGSAAATCWAASELVHHWGVRSMLYGDIDPIAIPPFSLDKLDLVLEPRFSQRVWHMNYDSLIGPSSWGTAELKMLLGQLARLKFNRILLSGTDESPASDSLRWRRFVVSGDTAGRAAFRGAKFFENPDLAEVESGDARRTAGQRLIRSIANEAEALGMIVEWSPGRYPPRHVFDAAGLLPRVVPNTLRERTGAGGEDRPQAVAIQAASVGDADLAVYLLSRGSFDAKTTRATACQDLVTPICGAGVADRVLKAVEFVEQATQLIDAGEASLDRPAPGMIMKHYDSDEPVPEWWGKVRDHYVSAMNEMYRANTRARQGGRSYTLYFARRYEFGFEIMNAFEAVRRAGIAKRKKQADLQIAELEKAVESINAALNALAAVARSQSDRGAITVLNEYGYRPLVQELQSAEDARRGTE